MSNGDRGRTSIEPMSIEPARNSRTHRRTLVHKKRSTRRTKTSIGCIDPTGMSYVTNGELMLEASLMSFNFQPTLQVIAGGATPDSNTGGDLVSLSTETGPSMTIPQGCIVLYCAITGSAIALTGKAAAASGYIGFFVALAFSTVTAILCFSSLMSVAAQKGAVTFSALCAGLPKVMGHVAVFCSLVFNVTALGVYIYFLYNALNLQLFDQLGDGHWPAGKAYPGAGRMYLYLWVIAIVFCASLPTSLSGGFAKVLNTINACSVNAQVIFLVVKGVVELSSRTVGPDPDQGVTAVKPDFVKGIVMLLGMMTYGGALPQLTSQIPEERHQTAIVAIPMITSTVQAILFVLCGLLSYFVLGDIKGDVFKAYTEVSPDLLCTLMQISSTLMCICTVALVALPPKAQIWALLAPRIGKIANLEEAPAWGKHGINAILVAGGGMMPLFCGEEVFMSVVVVVFGIFGTYSNLLLPALIVIYEHVIPARRAGEPFLKPALIATWILFAGGVCLVSSSMDVYELLTEAQNLPQIGPTPAPEPTPITS